MTTPPSLTPQQSDFLGYSWSSDEQESSISPPTEPKTSSSGDVDIDSNGDIILKRNCSSKLKSTTSVSFTPSPSLPPPLPFTRKRASYALTEAELRRVRLAKGKQNIGDDDEPIDVYEEDDEEEVCAPQVGRNNNYEKFLRLGPHAYYATQTFLKGRVLDNEVMSNSFVQSLLGRLSFQGRDHLFVALNPRFYKDEVVKFYANYKMFDGLVVSSKVNGVDIVFDCEKLGEILIVPSEDLEEYVWKKDEECMLTSKFSQGKETRAGRNVLKREISPLHILLFEIVNKEVLPRGGRQHEASFRDMGIMNALDLNEKINLPALMIKHIGRVTSPKTGPHGLAYGFLLTHVFKSCGVPLGEGSVATKSDRITLSTLEKCDYVAASARKKSTSPMTQSMLNLDAALKENAELQQENARLKERLDASQAQVDSFKTEMMAQQGQHIHHIIALMDLLPKAKPPS